MRCVYPPRDGRPTRYRWRRSINTVPLHTHHRSVAVGRRLAEQSQILFGTGFGTVTDIVTGPGGMYVLSLDGTLYRISRDPNAPLMAGAEARLAEFMTVVPEPGTAWLLGVTALVLMHRRRATVGR